MSKEVADVEGKDDVGERSCYHVEGVDGEPAWWQGFFEETSQVGSIDIYNIANSNLEGATIYIGEAKCNSLSDTLSDNSD
jgi:hypothetical protein